MKKILKEIASLTMIVSFSFAPIAFAQSDASGAAASPLPASSAQETSTPAPTDSSTGDTSATPVSTNTSSTNTSTTDTPATPVSTDAVAPPADTSPVAPPADASPAPPTSTDTSSGTATVNPQDAGSVTVQDTYNGQSAVSGDTLISTTDPQSASSSVDTTTQLPLADATSSTATSTDSQSIPIPDASSTPIPDASSTLVSTITGTSSADVVGQVSDPSATDASSTATATPDTPTPPDPQAGTTTDPTTTPQETLPVRPREMSIPLIDLKPKPQYAFAITGKTITAQHEVKRTDGTVAQVTNTTETLSPVVDNTTGAVTVSGQCSDAYFVVLLFKNATDYADDPSSYLVNRAYPCESGTFTYSVSDLPYNLPNGNYYLLVGQEGTTGSWTPITSLSEITINKNPQQNQQ